MWRGSTERMSKRKKKMSRALTENSKKNLFLVSGFRFHHLLENRNSIQFSTLYCFSITFHPLTPTPTTFLLSIQGFEIASVHIQSQIRTSAGWEGQIQSLWERFCKFEIVYDPKIFWFRFYTSPTEKISLDFQIWNPSTKKNSFRILCTYLWFFQTSLSIALTRCASHKYDIWVWWTLTKIFKWFRRVSSEGEFDEI